MKLAIVGVFYSGYKDLWVDFVTLFKKNWADCPYPLVIASNTADENEFCGVPLISAGEDAEYSKKVQEALKKVDADYYLLLLEDFFISAKVDNSIIENIISFILSNSINYYAMPMQEFSNSFKGKRIGKARRKISTKAEYTVSCQPAIWKRDFLEKCIGKANYNAWVFEGIYTKSKYAHTEDFLNGCVADLSNPLNIKHGALQGKLVPPTVDYFKKNNYTFSNKRETLSKKQYKKQQIKSFVKSLIPYRFQKLIKRVVKTNSVIEKYDSEIKKVMGEMGIE